MRNLVTIDMIRLIDIISKLPCTCTSVAANDCYFFFILKSFYFILFCFICFHFKRIIACRMCVHCHSVIPWCQYYDQYDAFVISFTMCHMLYLKTNKWHANYACNGIIQLKYIDPYQKSIHLFSFLFHFILAGFPIILFYFISIHFRQHCCM